MEKQYKILSAIKQSYLNEKQQLMDDINLALNSQDTFPREIKHFKTLIDRLAQVESSLEQVLFFEQQLNGNTIQNNTGDSPDS